MTLDDEEGGAHMYTQLGRILQKQRMGAGSGGRGGEGGWEGEEKVCRVVEVEFNIRSNFSKVCSRLHLLYQIRPIQHIIALHQIFKYVKKKMCQECGFVKQAMSKTFSMVALHLLVSEFQQNILLVDCFANPHFSSAVHQVLYCLYYSIWLSPSF